MSFKKFHFHATHTTLFCETPEKDSLLEHDIIQKSFQRIYNI